MMVLRRAHDKTTNPKAPLEARHAVLFVGAVVALVVLCVIAIWLVTRPHPAHGAELAPRTVVTENVTSPDGSSSNTVYVITYHVSNALEAARHHEEDADAAIAALGSVSVTTAATTMRDDGGVDIVYRYHK